MERSSSRGSPGFIKMSLFAGSVAFLGYGQTASAANLSFQGYLNQGQTDEVGYFGKPNGNIEFSRILATVTYDAAQFISYDCGNGATCWYAIQAGAMSATFSVGSSKFAVNSSTAGAYVSFFTHNGLPYMNFSIVGDDNPATNLVLDWYTADANGTINAPEPPVPGTELDATFYQGNQSSDSLEGTEDCGDIRDTLVASYPQYHAAWKDANGVYHNWQPRCSAFSNSAHGPDYTFSQYEGGDNYGWALVELPMVTVNPQPGLDKWVTLIGSPKHALNSGYRSPAWNAGVHGARGSRHLFGSAIDLKNNTMTLAEYNQLAKAARSAGASFIEPWSPVKTKTSPCYSHCVHADWGYFTYPYVQ